MRRPRRLEWRLRTFLGVALLLVLAAGTAPAPGGGLAGVAHASAAGADWAAAIHLDAVPHGYEGDDVTVASIDTGVVPGESLGSRLLARVDLTSERDGFDRLGHGTHIAGLIAGDGDDHAAAAPEANLVSVKVAGWDGATDVTTVIAALQWVVANRARYGIRVVNLAWGTDGVQPWDVDPLDAAVERAWRAGLVVVVSAGNSGPGEGTVAKPGDDPFVITVGAADTAGTADTADDAVAAFSSRGQVAGGTAKPDVVAPGVSLVSARAPGSTIDTFAPEARVGEELFRGTGSSQAAAIVSGVVARMLEAEPRLTPDQVKAALIAYQRTLPGSIPAASIRNLLAAGPELANIAPANQGLTPNTLIDPATGGIDYTRSSWSRSTWRSADGSNLDADFARSTWRCDCSTTSTGSIDPTRSTWRSVSMSSTTWLGLPPKTTTSGTTSGTTTTTTKTRK